MNEGNVSARGLSAPAVTDPAALGFDKTKLAAAEPLVRKYVDRGKIAGAVTLVARHGEVAQLLAVGRADVETDTPMAPDTLFRIFSLTKPVTSAAALILAERGLIGLDDPVERYIPAFRHVRVLAGEDDGRVITEPPRRPPTVRHLLTHTSGIAGTAMSAAEPLAPLYRRARIGDERLSLEETVNRLAEIPLAFHPGERWRYGISTDVLARIVEVASGMRFGDFLREHVFAPLGMHDTGFAVPRDRRRRLATLYSSTPSGQLRPMRQSLNLVNGGRAAASAADSPASSATEPADRAPAPALQSGSSGLVSTVLDYFRFAQMLLNGGALGGRRLLRPETVAAMRQNHLPESLLPYRMPWPHVARYTRGCGFGFGVRVVRDVGHQGVPGSVGEFGWAGAANTYLWIDPSEEMVVLLFAQAFPFMHTSLDAKFKALVYEALNR